jgi:hypothetical protein
MSVVSALHLKLRGEKRNYVKIQTLQMDSLYEKDQRQDPRRDAHRITASRAPRERLLVSPSLVSIDSVSRRRRRVGSEPVRLRYHKHSSDCADRQTK